MPDRPKPYPNNVLRIYSLGPTQTLYVDTGDYPLLYPLLVSNVVGLGDDEGFTFTGPTNTRRVALLAPRQSVHRGTDPGAASTPISSPLRIFTLDHGQYGLWAHDSSTNLALAYITSTNNTLDGIRVEGSSDALTFDHLTASYNGRYGIYIDGPAGTRLRNSLATNNTDTGIYLNNPGNVAVEGNESANNTGYGIYVYNSVGGTTAVIGDADLTQVRRQQGARQHPRWHLRLRHGSSGRQYGLQPPRRERLGDQPAGRSAGHAQCRAR